MDDPVYVHLVPGVPPPNLESTGPFRTVLVIENEADSDWRARVCEWLVRSGCLYMMAWGRQCSEWHDSVDLASLQKFDFDEIPDNQCVMTTWHEKESLKETFWFAGHCAFHSDVEIKQSYIMHIAPLARQSEVLARFREAQEEDVPSEP